MVYVDLYNIALGKINILDVNFLTGNEYHDEDSIWMKIRNVVTVVIKVIFYIAAALLITSLIWNGLNIVIGSITPEQRKNHIQALQRFIEAVLLLVGTIVIMSLGIFSSRMILPTIQGEDVDLPLRVSVEDADYNFSTNITGFVRYYAEIDNTELYMKKAMYTFSYLILATVNLLAAVLMLARMLIMMFLAMVGPIIATLHALGEQNRFKVKYQDWAKWYIYLSLVQVIFALVYRIILENAIIK